MVRRRCRMVEFDTNMRIVEIQKRMDEVKECVDRLLEIVKPENDLWDNSEITRKWKVSERTLASWRKERLIRFVQVKDKIWYPKEAREEFLQRNLIH
jgi:hypothetical protein